jgi:cell division protein ZapA
MKGRVVHVVIHGQRYAVRSDLDATYVAELAGYLDERMTQAATELQTADAVRVAVIAALNIADELFRAKAEGGRIDGRWRSRAADIEQLVDRVLGVSAEPAEAPSTHRGAARESA